MQKTGTTYFFHPFSAFQKGEGEGHSTVTAHLELGSRVQTQILTLLLMAATKHMTVLHHTATFSPSHCHFFTAKAQVITKSTVGQPYYSFRTWTTAVWFQIIYFYARKALKVGDHSQSHSWRKQSSIQDAHVLPRFIHLFPLTKRCSIKLVQARLDHLIYVCLQNSNADR